MYHLDMRNIKIIAGNFRSAILKCDKHTLPATLQNFPKGSCGDASLLLGEYFFIQGLGRFTYKTGIWADRSHAWIERNGIIVDITADQFDTHPGPVIVTKDTSWHSKFICDLKEQTCDISIYDDKTKNTLFNALSVIMECL